MEDLPGFEEQAKADSARTVRRETALAAAAASRARICAERNGVPLPDSVDVLESLREEAMEAVARRASGSSRATRRRCATWTC